MSEQRFDRIEQRLDRLEAGQAEIKADIDRRFSEVDRRFDAVDQRFDAVDQRFDAVHQRFDELGRHMRVLHEEVIERIAAIPERAGPTLAEFTEARDDADRRLTTLEAVAREHGRDIEVLKRQSS